LAYSQDSAIAYTGPSLSGNFLYQHASWIYNPLPEIFLERYSRLGESEAAHSAWSCSNPSGTKIMVRGYAVPTELSRCLALSAPLGVEFSVRPEFLCAEAIAATRRHRGDVFLNYSPSAAARARQLLDLPRGLNVAAGDARSDAYFGFGWGGPEGWGRWTEAESGDIAFRHTPDGQPAFLVLGLYGMVPLDGLVQPIAAELNGHRLGVAQIAGRRFAPIEARFEVSEFLNRGENRLRIVPLRPLRPSEVILNSNDGRLLGAALFSFRIE
jgi:hypothetical protein